MNELAGVWDLPIHVVDASCGIGMLQCRNIEAMGNITQYWETARLDRLTLIMAGFPGHWTLFVLNHMARTIRHLDMYAESGVGNRDHAEVCRGVRRVPARESANA